MTPGERPDERAVDRLSGDERRALVRCLAAAAIAQALRDEPAKPRPKRSEAGR